MLAYFNNQIKPEADRLASFLKGDFMDKPSEEFNEKVSDFDRRITADLQKITSEVEISLKQAWLAGYGAGIEAVKK